MRLRIRTSCFLFLAAVLGVCSAKAAPPPEQLNQEEKDFVDLVNKERQIKNLPALKVDSKLAQASQGYAKACADAGKQLYDSKTAKTPVTAAGYTSKSIAWDLTSGKKLSGKGLFEQFNRGKLLPQRLADPKYEDIGVSLFRDTDGKEWFAYYVAAPKKDAPAKPQKTKVARP